MFCFFVAGCWMFITILGKTIKFAVIGFYEENNPKFKRQKATSSFERNTQRLDPCTHKMVNLPNKSAAEKLAYSCAEKEAHVKHNNQLPQTESSKALSSCLCSAKFRWKLKPKMLRFWNSKTRVIISSARTFLKRPGKMYLPLVLLHSPSRIYSATVLITARNKQKKCAPHTTMGQVVQHSDQHWLPYLHNQAKTPEVMMLVWWDADASHGRIIYMPV